MCTINGQKMREQGKGIDTGSIFSAAKTAVENSFIGIQEKYQNEAAEKIRFSGVHEYNDDITEARQTGDNCGCFASGMAIWSLMKSREERVLLMSTLEEKYPELYKKARASVVEYSERAHIEYKAEKMSVAILSTIIQEIGKENNLTAIGEMFSAPALAETINKCNLSVGDAKEVHAVAASFQNVRQLKGIIEEAAKRHLRVMIPYQITGKNGNKDPKDKFLPDINGDINLFKHVSEYQGSQQFFTPENNLAHWATIGKIGEHGEIYLYEGNQKFDEGGNKRRGAYLKELGFSNLGLADGFSWTHFFLEPQTYLENARNIVLEKKRAEEAGKGRSEIIQQLQGKIDQIDLFLEKLLQKKKAVEERRKKSEESGKTGTDKLFTQNGDDLIEKVDLRGKVLLVGLRNKEQEGRENEE